MGRRPKTPLILSTVEREELLALTRRRKNTAQALALRARIVLACAEGLENKEVAARQQVTQQTISKWRGRFVALRLNGLLNAPRPGAPRTIDEAQVHAVLAKTLEAEPTTVSQWSTRSMARTMGMSQTAVSRIWRTHSLQPHHPGTFKLSSDPLFVEKVSDIIGLHIDPPLKAMALCVEKKSQIQALDRARPTREKEPSLSKLRNHDYMRYGTTTLFAALKIRKNDKTRDYFRSIRNTAFLKFLSAVESIAPEGMDVHLVMEDCCMPFLAKGWLTKRRCRFHVHFMPTAAS